MDPAETGNRNFIRVRLTKRQWSLLLDHAFVDDECAEQIREARIDGDGTVTVLVTASDLDDYIGWMAGATNSAPTRRDVLELNRLCDRLTHFQDLYTGKMIVLDSEIL